MQVSVRQSHCRWNRETGSTGEPTVISAFRHCGFSGAFHRKVSVITELYSMCSKAVILTVNWGDSEHAVRGMNAEGGLPSPSFLLFHYHLKNRWISMLKWHHRLYLVNVGPVYKKRDMPCLALLFKVKTFIFPWDFLSVCHPTIQLPLGGGLQQLPAYPQLNERLFSHTGEGWKNKKAEII